MKRAISNIAWSFDERLDAYDVLQEHAFLGVEIAPSLLFQDASSPIAPSAQLVRRRLKEIHSRGLKLCSMQSLLYGVADVALFEGRANRSRLFAALCQAIDLAERLEIPNLVFGSPKNRVIPDGMKDTEVVKIATEFFHSIGDYARKAGCFLALEATPESYGTNFLTRFENSAKFSQNLDHPAISVNFDIGSFIMNQEADEMSAMFQQYKSLVSHVHVSEPYLAPAPAAKNKDKLMKLFATLKSAQYPHYISIEMGRQDGGLKTLRDKAALLQSLFSNHPRGKCNH